ncbi:nuclear transport factor 2 family protein [Algoriphagus sp.]|uniref:nuclear transport factor 2 family protein n=1 Tax=Algoriphagus sp. TaxID=1872435 RepID=UPI0026137BCA|nr:nuclear transport factor 2 family protein [Algoriphagus sp.]
MNQSTREEMIQNYITAYNAFDVASMTENLSENVIFQNLSDGKITLQTEGIDEFKKQAELAVNFFESREQKITSISTGDSTLTITVDYQAVVKTDLPNGLKKGDTLNLKGKSTFVFEGETIVKIVDES